MSVQVLRPAVVEEAQGVSVCSIEPFPVAEGLVLRWEYWSLEAGVSRRLRLPPESETVLYVLSGALRLGDVPGIGGAVVAGGAQWVATGRELLFSQTALGGVASRGMHFSLRLPRHRVPGVEFLQLDAGGLPLVEITGGSMRTVADTEDSAGLRPFAALRCFDVQLEPGAVWNVAMPAFGLIYMVMGSAAVCGRDIDETDVAVVEGERGLRMEARESCRFFGMVGTKERS